MGPILWIAFTQLTKADAFRRLRLADSGNPVPFQLADPAYLEMDNGWVAVTGRFPNSDDMGALSRDGWALACIVDAASRFSLAQGYQRGRPCWSVIYDEQAGSGEMEALGSPPKSFAMITSRLMEEAAIAHRRGETTEGLFRAPIELAWNECGFWPDADCMGSPVMTRLEPAPPTKMSLRRRLSTVGGLFSRV